MRRSPKRIVGAAMLAETLLLAVPAHAQSSAVPPIADAPAPQTAPARTHTPGDPLENINRKFYAVNQALDRAIIRPAALGYRHVVPSPVRAGIRHFFVNLTEPIVFLNDILQARPKNAVRTFKRFLINTTLGIGGLIDVAKHEQLPYRSNGFGNTLGRYGVKAGPYLYLPVFGPSDLRDFAGDNADGFVLPTAIGSPFTRTDYRIAKALLTGLDLRAEADADLKALLDSALDPYATLRSVYLQSRAADIAALKGGGAADDRLRDPGGGPAELSDPLADPAATPAGAAPPGGTKAAPTDDPFATPPDADALPKPGAPAPGGGDGSPAAPHFLPFAPD